MGVERVEESLGAGQRRLLEMIAKGVHLQEILNSLLLLMESQFPGLHCTLMLLDEDGVHVRKGAGPSIAPSYLAAFDGLPIGPNAGSCGTAMYRKEPVVVSDILTDLSLNNHQPSRRPNVKVRKFFFATSSLITI